MVLPISLLMDRTIMVMRIELRSVPPPACGPAFISPVTSPTVSTQLWMLNVPWMVTVYLGARLYVLSPGRPAPASGHIASRKRMRFFILIALSPSGVHLLEKKSGHDSLQQTEQQPTAH